MTTLDKKKIILKKKQNMRRVLHKLSEFISEADIELITTDKDGQIQIRLGTGDRIDGVFAAKRFDGVGKPRVPVVWGTLKAREEMDYIEQMGMYKE